MAVSKYAGVFDFCTCDVFIWIVLEVISCLVLICATGPYWYYIGAQPSDGVNVAFFVISACTILILCTLGIIGALKKSKGILLYFGLIMIVMVLFTLAQVTLTLIALSNCSDSGSFFHFMCQINEIVYFAHSTVIVIVALVCSICAFILRWRLQLVESDPDNYYWIYFKLLPTLSNFFQLFQSSSLNKSPLLQITSLMRASSPLPLLFFSQSFLFFLCLFLFFLFLLSLDSTSIILLPS